jgi:hypothetical protein
VVVVAPVETASFFCAQAPKVNALATIATIMIALTNFNVYRLLSLPVAPACLGVEMNGRNAFLVFFA